MNQTTSMPLISPQSIWSYTPDDYRAYVRGLRDTYQGEQEAKKQARAAKAKKAPTSPIPGITFRYNNKGTPIITIRGRKPKFIAPREIDSLAKFHGVRQNTMWQIVRSKAIPVRTLDVQLSTEDLPW